MMWQSYKAICLGDCIKYTRNSRDWIQPMSFFLVLIALFGIGCGLEIPSLQAISPAIVWIVAFITVIFTVESLLRQEHLMGNFEDYILSPVPLWWLMLAKISVIWVGAFLPLFLLLPLAGYAMQLSPSDWGMLALSLGVGSPAVVCLAVMGTVLTLTLPRAGFLLCLILLPLYIPVLILGESVVIQEAFSAAWWFALSLLAGVSLLCVTLIPHATAAALKGAMYD